MTRREVAHLGALMGLGILGLPGCSTPTDDGSSTTDSKKIPLEPYRPGMHYSPADGRLADPNGLFWLAGTYHLFHQSDGRWAHATSPDLVHWQRLPIALEHDNLGQALSGSAVVDHSNRTGLFPAGDGVAAIYTNTEGGEAQSLALSSDQGSSWARYPANPVLKNDGRRDFRDPKVIWHAASSRWVMVVSVSNSVDFYGSVDLRSWTFLSNFGVDQGLHSAVWECPGLLQLSVDSGEESAWVLFVSVGDSAATNGSTMQYFVGDFDGSRFTNRDNPARVRVVDHGQDFYAAQSWFGLAEDRQVWIAWMGNWRYPYELPTSPWKGVMSLPRDLGLARVGDDLVLDQTPVVELRQLREDTTRVGPITAGGDERLAVHSDSFEFELVLRPGAGLSGLRVLADDTSWVEIGVNRPSRSLYVDRSKSAVAEVTDRSGGSFNYGMARSVRLDHLDTVRLHGFVDRSTIEVFDDAHHVLSLTAFGTETATGISVFGTGGSATIESLVVYRLRSIWNG